MKRIAPYLFILCALVVTPYVNAAWTFRQGVRLTTCASSSNTCTLTISGTVGGAGDVVAIFLACQGANSTCAISSATLGAANATLVASSGCQTSASSAGSIDCAYFIAPAASQTSIVLTNAISPTSGWYVGAVECSTSGTASFDKAGALATTSNVTNPLGPTLTLSGTNDCIVQSIRPQVAASAIGGGYTDAYSSFVVTLSGAYLLNTNSGTGPTWTTGSGHASADGIAFSEGGGSVSGSTWGGPQIQGGPSKAQ